MASITVLVPNDQSASTTVLLGCPSVKSLSLHCCNCFKSKENDPPTLLPNWVSKMSPCFGFAALHSVNPPTANGFPVATLISMFPDSDHFHSWLSAPVKDHISSLGSFVDMKFFLGAIGWQGGNSFFLILVRSSLDHSASCLKRPRRARNIPGAI